MNKTTTIILVLVALVVGAFAGFWFERSRATMKMEAYKMSVQKQMDEAKKMAENTIMKVQTQTASSSVMMTKGTNILTDAKGMTLYTFDKDTKNTSNCAGQCLVNWPPFLVSGAVPASLPAHLGTMKRSNGSIQYTWDGMPLYYYIGDKKAGDTTGDNVGGVWHVVK
jgi:predicted lipoprotein with Yx(FWY)xxD motif